MAPAAPVKEIGYAQAVNYNWWLYEDETTPELIWPQSVSVYDTMRRTDAQVTAVLRAVTLPVRRTAWRIDPAGASTKVAKFVAEDLDLPIVGEPARPKVARLKDKFSFDDHLRQALLMLTFGHMYFEQVYRVNDAGTEAHLRKLAPRMPKTIERIDVAPDGGLVSISQWWTKVNTRPAPIPVDRLVAYVNDKEGGNWLGQSLLRPAYKNWLIKDRLLRVQAQTIERNGMGIPLYTGAEGEESLAGGLGMATSWRSGEAAGSAVPFGANLRLVGVEGTLPDAQPAVDYHDSQIARAVLAHFLNLGTQTGSWALGTTFADFFTLSLQTVAQQIADTFTQHVIEDLVDYNFGEDEPAPHLVFDEIGSRQAATAQALKSLVDAGIVHPDQVLEESSRQQYGLPAADPATATPPPSQQAPTPPEPTQMGDTSPSVAASAAAEVPVVTPAGKACEQPCLFDLPVEAKYNPAQLRDPGGDDGGRWVKSPAGEARRLAEALSGQPALDATPAKLKRAPGGHHGDYAGEGLSGPKGMGSVRALSEYEGPDYQQTNTFLRGGYKDPRTGTPATGNEDFLQGTPERIAEIDKTMAVSRLTSDVKVDRVIKLGASVFGRDAWYGGIINWDTTDFDEQDREMEVWESGVRPDLTGLRWREPAYSSTTADPAVAKEFGKHWPESNSPMDGEPVIMTILVPKGTGGVQLAEMGHAAEILLQRDLTLEVVADDGVDSDGFRRIQVRVVPDGE